MSRCRSLDGHDIPGQVITGLHLNSHLLQHLRVEQHDRHNDMSIILGDGAQIRHLELDNIGMTFQSTRFRGLWLLSLTNISSQQGPRLKGLKYILRLSPGLQTLSLDDVAVRLSRQDADMDTEPLPPFHSMTKLRLRLITSRVYAHLMTRLRYPKCESVDLEPYRPTASLDGDHHVPFRHDTPHFVRQGSRMLLSQDGPVQVALGYRFDGSLMSLSSPGKRHVGAEDTETVGFRLQLRGDFSLAMGSLDAAEQVIDLVHQACPAASRVHLAVCPHDRIPQFLLEYIGRLRGASVEQIAISGSSNIHAILSQLA